MVVLKTKAQVSMEYLAIFTIAFMMTIPLVIIYIAQTQNIRADVTNAEAQKIASEIIDGVEEVYYMGAPSQKTLRLDFPEGIKEVHVERNALVFEVVTAELDYNITKDTNANMTGSIGRFSGLHIITFTAQEDEVLISDK